MVRPLSILTLAACCLVASVVATEAAAKSSSSKSRPAPRTHPLIAIVCYHDISSAPDAPMYSVPAESLSAHIRRSKLNGWKFLPLSIVLARKDRPEKLPPKVMVLTFDDGYRSFLDQALPILQREKIKPTISIISSFVDSPPESLPPLLTWDEIRQLDRDGLVEIASHTHDLHRYVSANPHRDTAPSTTTRRYIAEEGRYESRDEYESRLGADLRASRSRLREMLDHEVKVLAWPYGEFNARAREIAAAEGFTTTLGLEGVPVDATSLASNHLPRVMAYRDAPVGASSLVWLLPTPRAVRAAQVDVDDLYDPDPDILRANVDLALSRMRLIGATHVFLQGLADPVHDGFLREAYFMNHHVPVRADVWSMVAHRIAREGMKPWIRVPSLNLSWEWERHPEWRVPFRVDPAGGQPAPWYYRVSPDIAEARAAAVDFYTDLAVYLPVSGVLFDDDAYLRADEALVGSGSRDPATKGKAIRAYLDEIKAAVRAWRPHCRFGRVLFAAVAESAGAHPDFAQDLSETRREDDLAVIAVTARDSATLADPEGRAEELARRALTRTDGASKSAGKSAGKGGGKSGAKSGGASGGAPSPAPLLFRVEAYDPAREEWLPTKTLESLVLGLQKGGALHLGLSPVTPGGGELPANLLRPRSAPVDSAATLSLSR